MWVHERTASFVRVCSITFIKSPAYVDYCNFVCVPSALSALGCLAFTRAADEPIGTVIGIDLGAFLVLRFSLR